jgi:phenylpropionate dioxygenase-like ring-hydroxylating dioxygenase large terminal subunit
MPLQRPFPLNAWYAATWDVEVQRSLFPRTICSQRIVLYRGHTGRVIALEDACWHRMLPLSKGRLDGDNVECGYHGLVYNPEGRCIHMPSQGQVAKGASVRAYPVVERHRFVWIWMGDPSLADPSKVPDLHWNHDPKWSGDGKTIHAKCDYRLVIDNLMDLTHETFVHADSIGNRAVAEAPADCEHDDSSVTVTRWMLDIEPPPVWAKQLADPGGCDRWQIIRFEPPATIAIDVGVTPAGTGAKQGNRAAGVNSLILNTMTPETETTCHYFLSTVRNYQIGEQRLTNELREAVTRIFREDEAILEAQQIALSVYPGRSMTNLNIDAGGFWARRLIERMISAEATPDG